MFGISTNGMIDKFANRLKDMESSFMLKMPDGSERLMGSGDPKFEIVILVQRMIWSKNSKTY